MLLTRKPRSYARAMLHLYQRWLKSRRKKIHHMIYVGDKPGEGTNIGEGLVNAHKDLYNLS